MSHAAPEGPGDAVCPLCAGAGGMVVWAGAGMRLIRADEALHPAFFRLVWDAHVPEFSDLSPLQRATCIDALALVERGMRDALRPDKMNLASLGNMVPHLHWHLIARWRDDSHWPQPVWAPAQRAADDARLHALRARLPAIDAQLAAALRARFDA